MFIAWNICIFIFYGDNTNPIILKSEFVLSLCEQLMGKSLEPQQRSIIDRCTAKVYADYQQLQPIVMLVILDSIFNRITANRQKGRTTYIYIDEIYLLFQYEYSANFLFTLWKRVRKYGACCTGITQNVEDLLRSDLARTMLANSELIIMLNQATTDRVELAKFLNISDVQLSFITNILEKI